MDLTLFADDTSLVVSAQTYEKLASTCNSFLARFNDWCRSNNLILNVDKTKVIYFNNLNSVNPVLHLSFNNVLLDSSNHTKFLGIHLDSKLKWSVHIDMLSKSLNKSYYALSRIKNIMPISALLNVYYSLVYSRLCYNIVLWGNAVNSDRIFITQKRIIRKMFGIRPLESCKPIFIKNNILSFPCIYIFRMLLYAVDNIHMYDRNSSFHNYSTRGGDLLSVPGHRSSKFEMSVKYMSIRLFNVLPKNIEQ